MMARKKGALVESEECVVSEERVELEEPAAGKDDW